MLKKLVFLIAPLAPLAAVMAITTAPTPAAADTICSSGTPTNPTPVCVIVCKVPSVKGLKLHAAAVPFMHTHDCRVKVIFPKKKKGRRIRRIVVTKQSPGRGAIKPEGFKVTLHVKYVYFPLKP